MFHVEQYTQRAKINGKNTLLFRSVVFSKKTHMFVDDTCLYDTTEEAEREGKILVNLYTERAKAEADGFPVQSSSELDNGLTPD